MGSQRVGHDWATKLNWLTDPTINDTVGYIGLYCKRFMILFSQTHKKQNTFDPTVQYLEKHSRTVEQSAHRAWHWVNGHEESLTGGGGGVGRGYSWRTVGNRRWRVRCNLTHAWCLHLWNFTTWRFLCTVWLLGMRQKHCMDSLYFSQKIFTFIF